MVLDEGFGLSVCWAQPCDEAIVRFERRVTDSDGARRRHGFLGLLGLCYSEYPSSTGACSSVAAI